MTFLSPNFPLCVTLNVEIRLKYNVTTDYVEFGASFGSLRLKISKPIYGKNNTW
jgi:hypothetical protein